MIRRVLVANRGEIAVRIMRTCRALGLETVAVYSEADRNGLWVRHADRSVCIGPPPASASYLRAETLLAAAQGTGCDAIHPGYGFLAEDAQFAHLCEENGVTFVGPRADAIAAMGNKIAARDIASKAGVPTIPGSAGRLHDLGEVRALAGETGFPLLLKAAAGGGGRGMRIVREDSELSRCFTEAEAEARAAFGDGALYAERFLEGVRHVEVQVLGDRDGNVIHLGERDCTLQRRAQKLLEEAPAAVISARIRAELFEAALALVREIGYQSLGTIEFVFDPASTRFYFLEMNTRIQVEHPVTEATTNVDLVAEQLRVAAGEPLRLRADDLQFSGHAIECRINAEEFERDFRPSPGTIVAWEVPRGDGVRIDTHAYEGYTIPPFYDSLLAKLIVHGADRNDAIARTRAALGAFRIDGPHTTVAFHQRLLADARVVRNQTDTKWVEREFLSANALA